MYRVIEVESGFQGEEPSLRYFLTDRRGNIVEEFEDRGLAFQERELLNQPPSDGDADGAYGDLR